MKRDIIVIGGSSGGITAAKTLLAEIPATFSATIFIVIHVAHNSPRALADMLDRASNIPVSYAEDGGQFLKGHAYLAPPDQHLLLKRTRMSLVHGPKENGFRPAVDPLFRSAAENFGPRCIGIVLSGNLDDGSAGLVAIKECRGLAVVQDPDDAEVPSMPRSALKCVDVDYKVPAEGMGHLLAQLVRKTVHEKRKLVVPERIRLENEAARAHGLPPEELGKLGTQTFFICPQCNGPVWKTQAGGGPRFRCHVGHSYTAETFYLEQEAAVDRAMAVALRSMEDSASLAQEMAAIAEHSGDTTMAKMHRYTSRQAAADASVIRSLILRKATKTSNGSTA